MNFELQLKTPSIAEESPPAALDSDVTKMSAQLLLPSSSLNDLENCTQPSADSPDGDGTCSLSSTEERRPSQLHCAFCLGSSFLDESLGALIVAKADLARRRLSCYAMLLLLDKFNAEESASATGGTNLQEHPVPAGVQEGKSVNETKILKPPLDFHAAAVRLAGPFLLEKYTALFRDWFVRHRISRQLAELSRQPRSAASDNGSKVISERENQKPRDEGSERRESPGAAQAEASVPQSCRPTVLENSNPRPSAAAEEKSEVAKRRVTKFEVERGSPEAAKTLSKEEGTAADMAQSRSSASSIPVEPLKEPKVLAPPVCSEAHPDRHHLHHHYQHQEDSALPRRRLTASAAPSPNFNLRQSPSSPRRGRSTRSGGYLAALPSTTEGGAVAGSPSACCYFHPNGLQLAANARRQLLKFLEKHSDRRSAEARRRQATVASTLEAFWIRFGESPVSTPKAFFEKGGLQPALSLEAPLKNGSGDKGVGARIPNPPLSVWEFALLKTLREKQRSAGASLCSEEDLVHVASGGGPSSEESLEASLRKASSERLCHHAEPLGLDQVGDVAELFAALQNLQRTLHVRRFLLFQRRCALG